MADASIAGFVALGLIGLSTIPILAVLGRVLSQGRNGYEEHDKLYEDGDGVANAATQQAFSTALPTYILVGGTIFGQCLSIAMAVRITVHTTGTGCVEEWLVVSCWALLLIQVAHLFRERRPVKRFKFSSVGSAAFLVQSIYLCWHIFLSRSRLLDRHGSIPLTLLGALQFSIAAVSCLLCLLLPRRPLVFFDGQEVDGQYSVSTLNRWTFAWAGKLLAFAKRNGGLDMLHLPQLHLHMRSEYLERSFHETKRSNVLWKNLFWVHWLDLFGQSLLAMSQGIVQFAPQLAMYKLLELLEQRPKGQAIASEAWTWVIALGLSIVITAWVEAFLQWLVWSRTASPIRSELSALIMSKSLRRKDIKGHQKAVTEGNIGLDAARELVSAESTQQTQAQPSDIRSLLKEDEDEDEEDQKSRQSVVNLIAIDTKRISDFVASHWLFSQTMAKLGASIFFLLNLIGWQSLLAGFAFSALSLPFNIWVSSNYSKTQIRLMRTRDQKMTILSEALQGIRQIKFSALESQWQAKIGRKRTEELDMQWKAFAVNTVLIGIWILGPVMLSAVSLAVFVVLHGDLSPSIAFTTITVFSQMELVMAYIPELTADGLEAWVGSKRIGEYLRAPEKQQYAVPSPEISFDHASVAWPSDSPEEDTDRFLLSEISVKFPARQLSVIAGKTGSGKSLLLAAILGEVDKFSGTVRVPRAPDQHYDHKANKSNWIIDSAVAFVAQIPWIENTTIKANILSDLPFDQERYYQVLSSCALFKDLEMLPDGELTDIGADGINLSGGQRWRVTFARALYSRAGILVLDDIFSAVDAHVGRQLFDEALTGKLGQGRTRILVTHHVGLCLPKTQYAVLLGGGVVEHAGLVSELQRKGVLEQVLREEEERSISAEEKEEGIELAQTLDQDTILQKILTSVTERSVRSDDSGVDVQGKGQPQKFVEEEKREKGSVKLSIWREYLGASGGWWFWPPIVLFFLFFQLQVLGRSWWISLWTRSYQSELVLSQKGLYQQHSSVTSTWYDSNTVNSRREPYDELPFYLGTYVGISVLICVCGTWRYWIVFMASLKASRTLFDKLVYSILRAPLRWLDTVPIGRILNRFSGDLAVVDSRMGKDVGFMLYQVIQLVGITIAGLFVSPYMLLSALVLFVLCFLLASRFLAGAREVKRLESNAKSPMFEQFKSALAGIGTIRAFGKTDAYADRFFKMIDAHARATWYIVLFNRWLAIRLNIIGAIFAILVAVVIVSTKDIDASLAGFALSFALQYSGAIMMTIRQYASIELAMNAVERIVEYSKVPTETQEGSDVPAAWPTEGRLQVEGLVAGYAPDLPPVLKGLSFNVDRNQRVGVVGRTGAGKSSLTLSLFRFIEAREGNIVVDGIDISGINLQTLRSRLAIIPQDPVLFSGTVRSNLDAFDRYSDAELYDALERVHLIRGTGNVSRCESSSAIGTADELGSVDISDSNNNIFSSLSSRIGEGGFNLSQGQRQLLCLARAIISRPKIMVLDEATSAVDMATDILIQRSIREEFGDSTLIVIAHRLSTIADFDRILVMSDGQAVEFDTPKNLLAKRGAFWEMVEQSGERDRLEEIILGVDYGREEGRA